MRPVGDVCRKVLIDIEGTLLPSLIDLETGLELGIAGSMATSAAAARAQPAGEDQGPAAELDGPLLEEPPRRSRWE
jgi:hypothetical protein